MLPNLIGLGVERCGTTTLNQLLSQHPQVETPRKKELFFFNRNYQRGLDWYLGWYDDASISRYRADITPSYFRDVRTLRRIHRVSPAARIVISVRQPVERAFSHYIHRIRHIALRPGGYQRSFWEEFDTGARGLLFPLYAEKLQRILDYFPRERVLVLIFENDIVNIQSGYRRLMSFLQLDPVDIGVESERLKLNAGSYPHFRVYSADEEESARNTLFFHHAKGARQVDGLTEQGERELTESCSRWTRRITASECREFYERYFARDAERFAECFDVDIGAWQTFRDLEYLTAGAG